MRKAAESLADEALASAAIGEGRFQQPPIEQPRSEDPFESFSDLSPRLNTVLHGAAGLEDTPNIAGADQSHQAQPMSREVWLHRLGGTRSMVDFGVWLAWGIEKGFWKVTGTFTGPSQTPPKGGLFPLPVSFPSPLQGVEDPGCLDCSVDLSVLCWSFVCTAALNSLFGLPGTGRMRKKGKVHEAALAALEDRIRRMISNCTPCSFTFGEVREEIKEKRVSYTGEEISQPLPLSVEQMEKGLPPKGHGGSVPILPFLKGRTRYLVENPTESILPAGERSTAPVRAKVHIKAGEELKVFQLMAERGVIEWVPADSVFKDERGEYLNGLFGVVKQGKFTASHLPVLRCIMNLIPTNALFQILAGDITALPSATLWLPMVLCEGDEVHLSQGDMASAFYLFSMPRVWRPYMCFNFLVEGSRINREAGVWFRPSCSVLPMGWHSSVGLMQAISREVLISQGMPPELELKKTGKLPSWFSISAKESSPTKAWWQVYLDNFMAGEVGNEEWKLNQRLQELAMRSWKTVGILTAEDKQVLDAREVTELGVRYDGVSGLLGGSPERVHKSCLAALHLMLKPGWSVKDAQIVLGRWIFILQFRRPGMSVLSRAWEAIKGNWPTSGQGKVLEGELQQLVALAPLLQADLRTPYEGLVTVSDASEKGGAAACSKGLTWSGKSFTNSLVDPRLQPVRANILLISVFNGVGGSFRLYDVLGLVPAGRISIDWCREANRVTRSTWPDAEELHNVLDITRDTVAAWANAYSTIDEVHFFAGFPCIHLSSVRAGRLNLQGEGSRLFWVLLQILGWVYELFQPFAAVKFCVENVSSMDESARRTISEQLDVQPVKLDPSDNLPFNRPRLAWCSETLHPMEGLELWQESDYIRAWVTTSPVQQAQWIRPGWHWAGESHGTKLPTFMKSIRRHRPPPVPAGLWRTSAATRELWESENFRYPPYQFSPEYLLSCPGKPDRVLDCIEREIHTATCRSASDVKKSPKEYFDMRDTLCGDSFCILSFSIMAAAMCASFAPRMSPQQIVDRLGLAPGATAHPSVRVPMTRWLAYAGSAARDVTSLELVQSLGLTVNHTGADVRICSGAILGKRSAHASVKALWWQWKHLFSVHWGLHSHINFLEMKMILLSLLWRCRSPLQVNKRWFHLEDSMVCLYILTKGRTSSHLLQPLCRQTAAVQLAMSSVLLHGHVTSAENPTDAASRSWLTEPTHASHPSTSGAGRSFTRGPSKAAGGYQAPRLQHHCKDPSPVLKCSGPNFAFSRSSGFFSWHGWNSLWFYWIAVGTWGYGQQYSRHAVRPPFLLAWTSWVAPAKLEAFPKLAPDWEPPACSTFDTSSDSCFGRPSCDFRWFWLRCLPLLRLSLHAPHRGNFSHPISRFGIFVASWNFEFTGQQVWPPHRLPRGRRHSWQYVPASAGHTSVYPSRCTREQNLATLQSEISWFASWLFSFLSNFSSRHEALFPPPWRRNFFDAVRSSPWNHFGQGQMAQLSSRQTLLGRWVSNAALPPHSPNSFSRSSHLCE